MRRLVRTVPVLVLLGALLALSVPASAPAAATKSALRKQFNRSVDQLAAGKFKKFCKGFTAASLRRLDGVGGCVKLLRDQSERFNLREAATRLKVRRVAVSGSKGTVSWTTGKWDQFSTWGYESGRWRISAFLAGS